MANALPDHRIDNRRPIVIVFTAAFACEVDGSHNRMASLLNRISAAYRNVVVYSHANHWNFPWTAAAQQRFHERWPDVELVLEHSTKRQQRLAALKNLAISLFPDRAAAILRSKATGTLPRFDALARRAGAFVVNYKDALSQLPGIDLSRCIVETHDLLALKWAKLANASPVSFTVLRKLRGEMAVLNAAKGVIAISPAETTFFRMMAPDTTVAYVSSWEQPGALIQDRIAPEFDLVFVASGYVMNSRGFVGLLRDHGAWLSRYRIAVCGKICEDADVVAACARFPNITRLGFVDDIAALYARSKAALAPVDGTGLKIKIVSALQYGVPSLASDQAIDGLPPGYEDAVLPISEVNARRVLDSDTGLAAARAAAVRYHEQFNRSGEPDKALAMIQDILSETGEPPHSLVDRDAEVAVAA